VRNQLVSMSGPGLTASFSYDAVGRRASKTINGSTTSYLYDGANIVQEQTGGSTSANTLTGGVDTFFSRTDASGTVTPLRDALGTVVALTDASGVIQTSYSYEPFGKTTTSGTANSNTQKYTGREDDGTGLYYYRNRYYSPSMQRFISEDPLGLGGGDINFYAYVSNNPVMNSDPLGLDVLTADQYDRSAKGFALALGGRSCGSSRPLWGLITLELKVAFFEYWPGDYYTLSLGHSFASIRPCTAGSGLTLLTFRPTTFLFSGS
jgi:RHS repeat-associated protein